MGMNAGSVFAIFGIISLIIVMKVLICSCFFRRRQRNRREDTLPILEETAQRLQEIHQQRIRSRRAREPPPTFDDALRNSRPVSYIDMEDPPPTYEEFVNSEEFKETYLTYSTSVNPADVVIALDENFNHNNNRFGEESNA